MKNISRTEQHMDGAHIERGILSRRKPCRLPTIFLRFSTVLLKHSLVIAAGIVTVSFRMVVDNSTLCTYKAYAR